MSWDVIDLSQLPPPDIIDTPDFETILKDWLAKFTELAPEYLAVLLESDPAMRNMQTGSYRELLLRQRINEACKNLMLAYATGNDLDHIAANRGVLRHLIDPGDPNALPPVDPVYEDDESLRRRAQMAPEGYSTAGPDGAYIFHTLNAHADILDASVDAPQFALYDPPEEARAFLPENAIVLTVTHDAGLPEPFPGDVAVHVLSASGNGVPSEDVLAAVRASLNSEEIVPLTDHPHVRAAEIVPYAIEAELVFYPGPSADICLEAAMAAAQEYAGSMHKMGYDVTLSGILAALHQPGVQNVRLISPATDLIIQKHQASYCTGITLRKGGTDV